MKTRLAQRVYAVVVALHPRRFRKEYGAEMKLAFNDLLDDPDASGRRVWWSVLSDIANLMGGLRLGALFGFLVVLIWFVNRSIDLGAMDPPVMAGLGVIALLFVAAGFVGTRRSGSFAGGIWVGFVAGLISALTVPGDNLLFDSGFQPFFQSDLPTTLALPYVMPFVATWVIAAAIVMLFVSIGAAAATFNTHRDRVRRASMDSSPHRGRIPS